MRVVVQRSKEASCKVDGKITGKIDKGMVLLVGFTEGDNEDTIKYMINKIINLRIFDDENGVMNKSINREDSQILSISQFTLYGDATKGNRPSYIKALSGDKATVLYDYFNQELSKLIKVETGIFGAEMEISLINDGPITILLEKE
ncbi:MAG: D-tyrosyl-tRNA(Tyr) deacylase [Bacilli bacterium]|nr:D-tyrosyl-tRNA(Tyr) deacylase [Bacilli bacterium]